MNIFEIKTNGHILRIRKERFGCAIFSGSEHIEGNEITFEVLRILAEEKSLEGLLARLEAEYDVEPAALRVDLQELFAGFQPLGWFVEEYQQLAAV